MSWANAGGNIFDETLGESMLADPREGKHAMEWVGPVVPPASLVFDNIGVSLPPLVTFAAYPAPLHGAGYCEISVLGPGVLGCGEWIVCRAAAPGTVPWPPREAHLLS